MADKHMSCVAVVNDDGSIVGVFTARDFLTKVVLPGRNASETLVRDIMTKNPHCAPLDRTVLRCAKSMAKRNFRHLPIVDEKKNNSVIGLLSMADCARVFVAPFGLSVPDSAPVTSGVTVLPLH
jgi:CBS domain-containing protein